MSETETNFDRSLLRWNGWGRYSSDAGIGDRQELLFDWMGDTLGTGKLPETPAATLEETTLPPIQLGADILNTLNTIVGVENVKTDDYERAFHARGKSYADLVEMRSGNIEFAPDAVVYPANGEEVQALVNFAHENRIALVPFGGGSSVVGAVWARGGAGHLGVITLDTTRMDKLIAIDEIAMTATFEAGIYGPALEEILQAQGYTLGHYPQSFEFSTLGGWVSARGAGQQSNRYGKAERWLQSAKLATPGGHWQTEAFPASAAAANLNQLVLGHEGTLGVVTEATVRIRKAPSKKDYRGYLFANYEDGAKAIRQIAQSGVSVAMTRLSDPDETYFFANMGFKGKISPRIQALTPKVLNWLKLGDRPCLLLVGCEGDRRSVRHSVESVRAITKANKGFHLGTLPGKNWYKGRFHSPFLRDPMMDRGIGLDTLETATTWSNMDTLYKAVQSAIKDAIDRETPEGQSGIVLCHISHSYTDGTSLYFTFTFPRSGDDPMGQWQRIKKAASDAINQNGGTISHHHGVGWDHEPWMAAEKGEIGLSALKAVKAALDPKGVMNPGKVLKMD
ncbi:MAG: FAD-binding oxidoreductase [Alphaproteobacteria bacterium]